MKKSREMRPAPEPRPTVIIPEKKLALALPPPGTAAKTQSESSGDLVGPGEDFGFMRETRGPPPPAPAPETPPPVIADEKLIAKEVKPRGGGKSQRVKPPPAPQDDRGWDIKFNADETLYMELLLESRRKRVSMKYLILTILKQQGYSVDLERAEEDGRRNR